MRNLSRCLLLGAISALCLSSVWAADLKTFKEVYQKNSDESLQSYQPKFATLQQQYQKSLEALKALAVKRGELLKIKAAKAELERFQQAKSMPPEPEAATLPEIRSLQSAYVKQYNGLEQELTASLGTLTVKYEQALDRLQKELAKAERLDEATAVLEEREKAQAALKGYADQLSALKGPAATNAPLALAATGLAPTGGKAGAKKDLYLVVDLSRGPKADKYPISTLADVPQGGWSDEYKTDKLVLRKIEPGTFTMGSPEGELGRAGDEVQHEVTLTTGFYIGVFEVTQKQWERVMGDWPSHFNNPKYRDERPVEQVSYNDIRGAVAGATWPATNSVDEVSFMGRLRARTGKAFDLPTAAQCEYACRAGTATALNSGKDLTSTDTCPNLAAVARYKGNAGDATPVSDTAVGTAKAGSYLPNAWGLYDLHGNVWEWCLDWRGNYVGAESDPKGAAAGSKRWRRGGSWINTARYCASAYRSSDPPSVRSNYNGLRVVLAPGQQ